MTKKVPDNSLGNKSIYSVGIFSGTFDPVHDGHIAFARQSIADCSLDKVIFMPEKVPRAKVNVTNITTRSAQLQTALQQWPDLSVLIIDQPYFTVKQTLPALKEQFGNAHLTLLIGSDVVRKSLASWANIDDLVNTVSFAVGLRGDDSQQQLESVTAQIQNDIGKTINITYISTDFPHLSSSQLR